MKNFSLLLLFSLVSCATQENYVYKYTNTYKVDVELSNLEIIAIQNFSPDLLKKSNENISEIELNEKYRKISFSYGWGNYKIYVDSEKEKYWVSKHGSALGVISIFGPYKIK